MRVSALDSMVSGVDVIALQPVWNFDLVDTPVAGISTPSATRSPRRWRRVSGAAEHALETCRRTLPFVLASTVHRGRSFHQHHAQRREVHECQLDLAGWRFDGEAAAIAFHATGSIDITGTISDGFGHGTGSSQRIDLLDGNSSSLSFDAGADLLLKPTPAFAPEQATSRCERRTT